MRTDKNYTTSYREMNCAEQMHKNMEKTTMMTANCRTDMQFKQLRKNASSARRISCVFDEYVIIPHSLLLCTKTAVYNAIIDSSLVITCWREVWYVCSTLARFYLLATWAIAQKPTYYASHANSKPLNLFNLSWRSNYLLIMPTCCQARWSSKAQECLSALSCNCFSLN